MTAATVDYPAPNDAGRVYTHVRRGIIEGRYPPGARLVEQQVSAAVSVSRTPVREAIRRLESGQRRDALLDRMSASRNDEDRWLSAVT